MVRAQSPPRSGRREYWKRRRENARNPGEGETVAAAGFGACPVAEISAACSRSECRGRRSIPYAYPFDRMESKVREGPGIPDAIAPVWRCLLGLFLPSRSTHTLRRWTSKRPLKSPGRGGGRGGRATRSLPRLSTSTVYWPAGIGAGALEQADAETSAPCSDRRRRRASWKALSPGKACRDRGRDRMVVRADHGFAVSRFFSNLVREKDPEDALEARTGRQRLAGDRRRPDRSGALARGIGSRGLAPGPFDVASGRGQPGRRPCRGARASRSFCSACSSLASACLQIAARGSISRLPFLPLSFFSTALAPSPGRCPERYALEMPPPRGSAEREPRAALEYRSGVAARERGDEPAAREAFRRALAQAGAGPGSRARARRPRARGGQVRGGARSPAALPGPCRAGPGRSIARSRRPDQPRPVAGSRRGDRRGAALDRRGWPRGRTRSADTRARRGCRRHDRGAPFSRPRKRARPPLASRRPGVFVDRHGCGVGEFLEREARARGRQPYGAVFRADADKPAVTVSLPCPIELHHRRDESSATRSR